MKKWAILPEKEDENDEEQEEFEPFEEDISNIITETPTSFRRISPDTNPFLESTPIENLEQDIQPIPTTTTTITEPEEPEVDYATTTQVINEPQYGASYEQQPQRRADVQRDVSGGALTMRDDFATSRASMGGGMDFRTWQRSHAEGQHMMSPEDQVGAPQRLSTDVKDPFKRKSDYVP